MRAIISDVHANLEALQAVLRDIEQQGADEIYCLGDIIDYGPNPRECIDLLMGCKVVLMGDRDHATLYDEGGDFGTDGYQSAVWTRNELESLAIPETERARRWDFLAGCPQAHREGEVLYVHSSPLDPLSRSVDERNLRDVFEQMGRYCFHGHTHIPGIFLETSEFLTPRDVDEVYRLERLKTLVDVGSVGQPREGDRRACYVLLDGDTVRFRQVEYNIGTTLKKLESIPDLPNFLRPSAPPEFIATDWIRSTDPHVLLSLLATRTSERKLRLFACACCRRIWDLLTDPRSRSAVCTAERFADGQAKEWEVKAVSTAAAEVLREQLPIVGGPARAAAIVAHELGFRALARLTADSLGDRPVTAPANWPAAERRAQADLLRHIVGNPFRPYAAPASWPIAVVQLAEAQNAGGDCAFALHDALLEAGHADLAAHFREPRHPKGCWVVDLILGKS